MHGTFSFKDWNVSLRAYLPPQRVVILWWNLVIEYNLISCPGPATKPSSSSLMVCFQNCCRNFQSWNYQCWDLTLLSMPCCPPLLQCLYHYQTCCGPGNGRLQEIHYFFRLSIPCCLDFHVHWLPDSSCSLILSSIQACSVVILQSARSAALWALHWGWADQICREDLCWEMTICLPQPALQITMLHQLSKPFLSMEYN